MLYKGKEIIVNQLYIGRDGCRCGCGGRYIHGINTIKKHYEEHKEVFNSTSVFDENDKELILDITIGHYANGDVKKATLYFEYKK